jgi:TatA/E family protein of Tat protein translocase
MASLSIWHWLIVLCVVVVIFGTKEPSSVGSSIVAAITNFKQAISNAKPMTFRLWFIVAAILLLSLIIAAQKLTAR